MQRKRKIAKNCVEPGVLHARLGFATGTMGETHGLFISFHNQSSLKVVSERKHSKETGGPNGLRLGTRASRVVASLRSFPRLARAASRVLYARTRAACSREGVPSTPRKHLALYSSRSRVELEAECHSTRASRRNIKRFRAFELSREADDAEGRARGRGTRVGTPRCSTLLLPSSRSSPFVSYASRCLINVPRRFQALFTDDSRVCKHFTIEHAHRLLS